MMMNILVICLVLSSQLLTAASTHREVIINKVLVEYDKEADRTTRASVSPQNVVVPSKPADEKPAKGTTTFSSAKELVCDAYGKCKNKISGAFTEDTDIDKAEEIEEHTTEAVNEVIEKPPQRISEAKSMLPGRVAEKAKSMLPGQVAEKLPGHTLGEFLTKAKDSVAKGLIGEAKKFVSNVVSIVKEGTSKEFDIIDSPKRIGEDISRNVTGEIKESAENMKKQAKETVKNVEDVLGQGSFSDMINKLKEMAYNVVWYVLYRDKLGSVAGLVSMVAGLVHMVGFSTAYGVCVWVTFVSSYILSRCLPRQLFGLVQSRIYPVYFRALAYCVFAALLGHLVSEKNEVLGSKIGMFQSLSLVSALLMVLTNMILLEPRATKAMYKRMKLEKEEGRGLGAAFAAKDGMVDGGGGATVVRSAANGRGVRVAVAAKERTVDGSCATMARSVANGVAGKDGMADGRSATVGSVAVDRQDVLRLNEKLKRLNAYSSALNLFTLVALTWHMAYMGQRLQAIHGK